MKKVRFSKDGRGVLSPSYNSSLKFSNKPVIIPMIRRIFPKSFRESMDEAILENVKEKAKKETEGKKVKEFLEEASTKFGEDE